MTIDPETKRKILEDLERARRFAHDRNPIEDLGSAIKRILEILEGL